MCACHGHVYIDEKYVSQRKAEVYQVHRNLNLMHMIRFWSIRENDNIEETVHRKILKYYLLNILYKSKTIRK